MSLSVNAEAVRSRIRRLPKLAEGLMDATRKRDALLVLKLFRENVEEGRVLPSLSPRTVKAKKRKGYGKPEHPLRGLGMDAARTYARSMRVYKIRDGWRVRMPAVRHHESRLDLAALFGIHENGATIDTGRITIRIPARPALATAYREALRQIAAMDPLVGKACTEYANTGGTGLADKILAEAARLEAQIHGTAD